MLGKSKLECSDNEGTKTLNSEHYCGVKFQEMMRKSKQICSDNRVLSKPYYLNKLVLIFSSILLGGVFNNDFLSIDGDNHQHSYKDLEFSFKNAWMGNQPSEMIGKYFYLFNL